MGSRRSRRLAFVLASAALAVAATTGNAANGDGAEPPKGPAHYTIGLFGDMPYNARGRAD